MLKKREGIQWKLLSGTIEELMPEEHFLRDLDRLVDFSFVYEKVEKHYSNIGRSSIDPIVMVKMLLIGYLYGIDSERKLVREIEVNIAYRWFLGIDLDEKVPDHSTISQLRKRKFNGTNVVEEIFDEIVKRCIDAGMVDGSVLLTDSTHLKANASNDLYEYITVSDEPTKYMQRLDEAALKAGLIKESNSLKPGKEKEVRVSKTDPECGHFVRPGKPRGFYYLNHQTCDGKHGIITDTFVTAGNVKDNVPHSDRIQYQIKKYGFETKEIGADAGYDSSEIYNDMLKMNISTFIPYIKQHNGYSDGKRFEGDDFKYCIEDDTYLCPNNCKLYYKSFLAGKGQKIYKSVKSDCDLCSIKDKCIFGKATHKEIHRSYYRSAIEIQRRNVKTPRHLEIMRLRQIWCEGNFSHQKSNHNLTRTRKRGIAKVQEQCFLSACALNLKRLVKHLKELHKLVISIKYTPFLRGFSNFCQPSYFFPLLSTAPPCRGTLGKELI